MDGQLIDDVNFIFDEKKEEVTAEVKAMPEKTVPTTLESLHHRLAEQGYGEFHYYEPAMYKLLKQINDNEAGSVVIGQRLDAEISVTVSPNSMVATLFVAKACGGKAATEAMIREALDAKKVTFGIIDDVIKNAVEEQLCEDEIVAKGQAAVPGEDGRLESLIPNVRTRKPLIDSKGIADFRELNDFVNIEAGTPLMRRIAAGLGEKGHTVYGQELATKPGKTARFGKDMSGVIFSPEDPNLLIAEITGYPIAFPNGIIIEPRLGIEEVDLASGNVTYDGNVFVKGDVNSGMKVSATKDVVIQGAVGAATIIAGGNVIVKKGILGGSVTSKEATEDDRKHGAHIEAGKAVSARFIDNAFVEAKESVSANEYISHSKVYTAGNVYVGVESGGRGVIMGGKVIAKELIKAKVLGAKSHIPTSLTVGIDPKVREEHSQVKAALAKEEKGIESLKKVLLHLKQQCSKSLSEEKKKDFDVLMKKTMNSFTQTKEKIVQLEAKEKELALKVKAADNVHIEATQGVHIGVYVNVASHKKEIIDPLGAGRFMSKANRLTFVR